LYQFEKKMIRLENRIGRTVLPAPPVTAAPTASPRCLVPHPATDDWAPVASRPNCQPPRHASCRPRSLPLSGGNAPTPCRHAAPHRAMPPPPLPLSLPLRLHAAPTHLPPSPPLPIKTESPLTGRIFLPARRSSRPSTPECCARFPHRLGICLAGLCPSIIVVRPFPVSTHRATPFLNRPPPPNPAGLPRAAGPLHAHRQPPELPRLR
jgi:hypothetical protein